MITGNMRFEPMQVYIYVSVTRLPGRLFRLILVDCVMCIIDEMGMRCDITHNDPD